MIQIQWFQAVLMLLGLIVSSVVVIANYRRSNEEQQDRNKEVWEEAVKALDAHNNALQDRLRDAEELQQKLTGQVGVLQGMLTQIERDKRSWQDRNQHLYDLVQTYRARLARLGVETPSPEGNGEGYE